MLKASVHPLKQRPLGSVCEGMEDEQDSSKCPGSDTVQEPAVPVSPEETKATADKWQ